MGTNSGRGFRFGQQKDRYQTYNTRTERWDKYDSAGNHVKAKKSKGAFKGVEKRDAKKPPRKFFGLFYSSAFGRQAILAIGVGALTTRLH